VEGRSDRSDAADAAWSELEQRFFESAPPDVAVLPPAPPTFDDLAPIEPAARPSRASRGVHERNTKTAARTRRLALARLRARARAFFRRTMERAGALARPAMSHAQRWALQQARASQRRIVPALRSARSASAGALRAVVNHALDRVVVEWATERPDGKTILAAVAGLIVVFGLSASVLGHAQWTPLRAPAIVVAPAPAAIAAAAPSVEPSQPSAALEPSAPAKLPGAPRHHVSRRHAHHGVAAPSRNVVFAR